MKDEIRLVYFQDLLEEKTEPQYGILQPCGSIVCLCCGGIVENYKILEYCKWFNFSQAMKDGLI